MASLPLFRCIEIYDVIFQIITTIYSIFKTLLDIFFWLPHVFHLLSFRIVFTQRVHSQRKINFVAFCRSNSKRLVRFHCAKNRFACTQYVVCAILVSEYYSIILFFFFWRVLNHVFDFFCKFSTHFKRTVSFLCICYFHLDNFFVRYALNRFNLSIKYPCELVKCLPLLLHSRDWCVGVTFCSTMSKKKTTQMVVYLFAVPWNALQCYFYSNFRYTKLR